MSNIFKKFLSSAHNAWYQQSKKGLLTRILAKYGNSKDTDVLEVLGFLDNHPEVSLPMGMIPPYEWVKKYSPKDILVEKDPASGLLYVMSRGYKVFFPRESTPAEIQEAVSIGLMEQDQRSPHCYVGEKFNVDTGDVAVFIGASDGLFCLSLIDRLSKAYLFEPGTRWHEPLKATVAPFGNKVEIFPYAAASTNGEGGVSLDSFFKNRPLPNYIQVDVDGWDRDVLDGASNVLKNATKLRLSLCTYHKRLDFVDFEALLSEMGYTIHHSPGFFLIGVRMPYLRRGVLYASKGV